MVKKLIERYVEGIGKSIFFGFEQWFNLKNQNEDDIFILKVHNLTFPRNSPEFAKIFRRAVFPMRDTVLLNIDRHDGPSIDVTDFMSKCTDCCALYEE